MKINNTYGCTKKKKKREKEKNYADHQQKKTQKTKTKEKKGVVKTKQEDTMFFCCSLDVRNALCHNGSSSLRQWFLYSSSSYPVLETQSFSFVHPHPCIACRADSKWEWKPAGGLLLFLPKVTPWQKWVCLASRLIPQPGVFTSHRTLLKPTFLWSQVLLSFVFLTENFPNVSCTLFKEKVLSVNFPSRWSL